MALQAILKYLLQCKKTNGVIYAHIFQEVQTKLLGFLINDYFLLEEIP